MTPTLTIIRGKMFIIATNGNFDLNLGRNTSIFLGGGDGGKGG